MSKPIPFLDLKALHAEIRPDIDDAFRRVTDSGQFVGGEFVERFEAEWAAYCGTRYAVGVSDGTAAIELSLRALGIGPGSEVIVPTNTFVATWEAVAAAGALPVPVDVDPRTLLMTADAVDAACTEKTAAVIAVHLFGQPVDMDAMRSTADRRGIALIEDAAQAHGATWMGRRVGGFGDAGCFSFYPGKNLGAFGDAGAVATNDRQLADRIRSFGNHGRSPTEGQRHLVVGDNRRLDGLQAAILSAKLPHLDRWNRARSRAADDYRAALAGLPVTPVATATGAVSVHHLAVVELDQREAVRDALAQAGIGTGIHYAEPCHRQPAFARLVSGQFPVSERAAARILSLPMGPHVTTEQITQIANTLARALAAPAFGTMPTRRRRRHSLATPGAAAAFVPTPEGSTT
jgi:dTDP-4-amino-4,6-dideoxygalactose transaminase